MAAFPPSDVVQLERAYIQEISFDRPGSLEKEFPGRELPEFITHRRIVERFKPPSTWPF